MNNEDIKRKIDHYLSQINVTMHDAARESGCSPINTFKPKINWCPELSNLSKKKKLWWDIWTQNGRPRAGIVYECYKGTKKMFRRLSRQCMRDEINIQYNRLNSYFHEMKINRIWKGIKRLRHKRVNSSLCTRYSEFLFFCHV